MFCDHFSSTFQSFKGLYLLLISRRGWTHTLSLVLIGLLYVNEIAQKKDFITEPATYALDSTEYHKIPQSLPTIGNLRQLNLDLLSYQSKSEEASEPKRLKLNATSFRNIVGQKMEKVT
ncbi:uncharacterized protein LOC121053137 [Rosa chinensis]|uniref:uncharacterized protein LOC121053137 n=1 Tax=Rosa chinensis TaxID=74649 RepID=UPI001AD91956|nr:uncharacterized protein LOC121053137 [Rosa chinensis]